MDRRAWHVARSESAAWIEPWTVAAVIEVRCPPPQSAPTPRLHILSQRASLIRGRPDREVPVVRRAPLGDDREDLDALVPTGDAARCLVASMPRVAVDRNREWLVTTTSFACFSEMSAVPLN